MDFIKIESVTDEMYRCIAEQGNFFARITNYKTYEEQLEEVTYTNFLYKEDFGVPPTMTSLNGIFVEKISLDREVLIVLYHAASGVHLPRSQWNANVLKELGRQIGRLYRLPKKFKNIEPIKYINDWHDNGNMLFLNISLKKKVLLEKLHKRFYLQ